MVYRPLFWTSYWCEGWLSSSGYRSGATTILISSASSKTAFCLAYLIRKRIASGGTSASTKIIGLTSRKNVPFTQRLDLYHEVLDYDQFTTSPSLQGKGNKQRIYLDVAGNEELNKRILHFFASQDQDGFAALISLGMTNVLPSQLSASTVDWKENKYRGEPTKESGLAFEPFFMPEWLNVRKSQLPREEIFKRQNQAWKDLMKDGIGWVRLLRCAGGTRIRDEYMRLSREGLAPDTGMVWSLWENQPSLNASTAKL